MPKDTIAAGTMTPPPVRERKRVNEAQCHYQFPRIIATQAIRFADAGSLAEPAKTATEPGGALAIHRMRPPRHGDKQTRVSPAISVHAFFSGPTSRPNLTGGPFKRVHSHGNAAAPFRREPRHPIGFKS